jgi:hypothetical protein
MMLAILVTADCFRLGLRAPLQRPDLDGDCAK